MSPTCELIQVFTKPPNPNLHQCGSLWCEKFGPRRRVIDAHQIRLRSRSSTDQSWVFEVDGTPQTKDRPIQCQSVIQCSQRVCLNSNALY